MCRVRLLMLCVVGAAGECYHCLTSCFPLQKTNMEPDTGPLVDDCPLERTSHELPCVFQSVSCLKVRLSFIVDVQRATMENDWDECSPARFLSDNGTGNHRSSWLHFVGCTWTVINVVAMVRITVPALVSVLTATSESPARAWQPRFPVIVVVNKVDCLLDKMRDKEKAPSGHLDTSPPPTIPRDLYHSQGPLLKGGLRYGSDQGRSFEALRRTVDGHFSKELLSGSKVLGICLFSFKEVEKHKAGSDAISHTSH